MGSSAGLRTRWAAIGAACAVTLGGGTFGVVRAVQTSGERATYVPVSPARILDTRTDVGAVDIVDATPVLLTVTGNVPTTKGPRTIVPAGASGVVVNITAVNPSVNGFVSLRPGDTTGEPDVSTLNVTAGGIFPNGATITLPTSGGSAGQVQIWFEGDGTGGRTDMLVDVVGYYTDHNHDDRYYTETEVNTALAGKANSRDLLPIPAGSTPTTVDAPGNTGFDTSIAIGVNGFPVISYRDATNGDLRVAACADVTCSTAATTTVDATGDTGYDTSIAIGVNGFPVISYRDATNGDLRVAACANVTCSTATTTTVDAPGNTGYDTSIAIGTNGFPVISYRDVTNGDLRVAACADVTCSTAATTLRIVDATGNTGAYTSIAIGVNGFPVISYRDVTNGDLRVAACADVTCSTAATTLRTVDATGDTGFFTSIAIGTNGFPVISYFDNTNVDLRVAACANVTCSTATTTTVDPSLFTGYDTSIAIGVNGFPVISYRDGSNADLRVAACANVTCSTATTTTVDATGDTGNNTSIAIGVNGSPVISYYDATNGDLRFAIPWWVVGGR